MDSSAHVRFSPDRDRTARASLKVRFVPTSDILQWPPLMGRLKLLIPAALPSAGTRPFWRDPRVSVKDEQSKRLISRGLGLTSSEYITVYQRQPAGAGKAAWDIRNGDNPPFTGR
jgi:hypothetical protein